VDNFRLIVAGGRNFSDYELLKSSLDKLLANKNNIVIISGKAKGADSLGEKYALERNYKIEEFPANWDEFGKSAGHKRNIEMSKVGDALAAFWDGISPGTRHMIQQMKNLKKPIRIIHYEKT
jgi:hypothetical protein